MKLPFSTLPLVVLLVFALSVFWGFSGLCKRPLNAADSQTENAAGLPAESATTSKPSFPKLGILPKQEIGALRFLKEFPRCDGRGVVVAIFDTGVDPGAAGLRATTVGEPKIIDMIDGTGSGDVDTSTVREADGNMIEGLSGRALRIDSRSTSPDGKYHIGLKRAYDFYPDGLIPRLTSERRREFDKKHRVIEANLRRQIAQWQVEHPEPSTEEVREREELDTRLEQLRAAAEAYDDPGPVFDCVVFHDGDVWRAMVDTDEDGDLTDETLLTDFRAEQQYGTFGGGAELNFAVNIFGEGNRLSIVTDSGSHGTHVAGIVAAHFPDQPELNGIAPGAQIVSVKIGDSRLGSMETGSGLERGLIAAIRNQCDVINMSFGEPTKTPDRGRLSKLFSRVVNEHGVAFVAAAGIDGPALSTLIAPGGTNSAVMGVGAYVSPQMMAVEYSLRDKLPEMPYTFTSLGPASDGAAGVNFCAPGGAIAPVPHWTLSRKMRMNGTSMASPNASGAVALLVSAAKSRDVPYSPYSLRRALETTARGVPGASRFAQGAGLIQVDRAFAYMERHATDMAEQLQLEASVLSRQGDRGIYLREAHEVARASNHSVSVRPAFPERADNQEKIDFEMRLTLHCDEPWVQVGQYLFLNQHGGTFEVFVDSTQLEPGAHFAEVVGRDANHGERGPVFRLPVTVIVPDQVKRDGILGISGQFRFTPGETCRRFVAVPLGATWMDLSLRRPSRSGARRYMVQTIQRLDGKTYRDGQSQAHQSIRHDTEIIHSIPVEGGRTIEISIAQYWSSLGESDLEYRVTFQGLAPDDRQLTLPVGQPAKRVTISAPLDAVAMAPSAKLDVHRTAIRPTTSEIRPLSAQRDTLPDGRQVYSLTLTYEFQQSRASMVTPRFPANDDLLYDSQYGTQLWMMFDAARRLVASDDIWPSPVKLEKGRHTLRLQLRHTDPAKLEKTQDAILWLDRPLSSPISVDVYGSREALDRGTPSFREQTLNAGQTIALYLAIPSAAQLPSDVQPGDSLLGQISYGKSDASHLGAGQRPGGYPLTCVVAAAHAKESDKDPAADKDKPGEDHEPDESEDDLSERLLQSKVSLLNDLSREKDEDRFEKLAGVILDERPDHLPVLVAKLHRLDTEADRKERLGKIVSAADTVISRIDTQQMVLDFGTKREPNDEMANKQYRESERQREILADALYRKGRALGYMELPEVLDKQPIEDPQAHAQAFEANFAELRKWVDTTDEKYALLHVRRDRRNGHLGSALRLLNRHISSSAPNRWYYKKRRDIYQQLGWQHLRDYETAWLLVRFPAGFAPF